MFIAVPLLSLLLVSSPLAQELQTTWHGDYATAVAAASADDKPLLVLLCDAPSHFGRMTGRSPFVSDRVEQLLQQSYVRIHIDTASDAGRQLARQFEVERKPHWVILDRSGKWQVFYKAGHLSESELAAVLTRFRTARIATDGTVDRQTARNQSLTATAATVTTSYERTVVARPRVVNVTESDFDREVIQRSHEHSVVVDFSANWCGPCRALAPILERSVSTVGGEMTLVKIDIDQAESLARRYHVDAIPTVKVFHKGEPVNGFVGLLSEAQLRQFLASSLPPSQAEGN